MTVIPRRNSSFSSSVSTMVSTTLFAFFMLMRSPVFILFMTPLVKETALK